MASDIAQFIVQQLAAHGIEAFGADRQGTHLQALCFRGQDQKTRSLSIRKSDGAFNCFGCSIKGKDWNALAAMIGGQELSEENLPDPFELMGQSLHRYADKEKRQVGLPQYVEPWQHGPYRGLSEAFLHQIEAQRWYDHAMRCYRILWPAYQHQELLGWISRRLDSEKEMKYRNYDGLPAKRILFPYDFVAKHFDCRVVVLVEGPVDALRLCFYRIPALAILGTNNWHEQNKNLLLSLGTTHVIICTDADPAGIDCRYSTLEPSLEDWFTAHHFDPPHKKDPGNMPKSSVLSLRELYHSLLRQID